jgi:hypothetical protein
VGGHYINAENFLFDLATQRVPRLFQLSASAIAHTSAVKTANEFLYDDPGVRYRNLLLMPCDDGTWHPPFDLLANVVNSLTNSDDELSWLQAKCVDDLRLVDNSLVTLNDLVSTASLILDMNYDRIDVSRTHAEDFMVQSIGATPDSPSALPGKATQGFANAAAAAAAYQGQYAGPIGFANAPFAQAHSASGMAQVLGPDGQPLE